MINELCKFSRSVVLVAAISLISTAALAQGAGKGREIILAPYLWATAIDGTSTVGALPPLDIDASFSDLLSNLEMAFSLHTEFRFGEWVFVVDPTFLSLGIDIPIPSPPAPQPATAKMDVDIWLVELWGGYRLSDNWEAIGGLRYQNQDISVSGLPSPPFPAASTGVVNENWTDWFVGARFNTDLGAKWLLTWRADVVFAGDSDTSWNTSIFFNRRIRETMALNLGYRYFIDDFNDPGSYRWDVTYQGPVIGYTWVF